jgi:hypothetical protein
LTLPCEFSFETGCNDVHSIAIFNAFIHPCILSAEFCGGRLVQSTFEYYQPNMMARQLGCGQVPPRLFLHEFLKPREHIKESIEAKRIFAAQPFMHPSPLCQQHLLILLSSFGGKDFMITFLTCQYILCVLS